MVAYGEREVEGDPAREAVLRILRLCIVGKKGEFGMIPTDINIK